MQKQTIAGSDKGGLRSSSLGWEVGYEKIAEMCGGKGYLVSTPEGLARATEEGFKAGVPVVVNVIIESGKAHKLVRSNPILKQTRLELAGRFRLVMLQI
jgi:2-hydroxyacyl-CoA lyase 1